MIAAESIHILVIDDDVGDVKLIRNTLQNAGGEFVIHSANSLAAGIQKINEISDIQLVLLDLLLPESHGLETVDKFLQRVSHLPIIVLTGLDNEEIGIQAIHKGAQDYLIKGSYDHHGIARSIRYAIERYRAILQQKKLEKLKDEFISMASHELRTPMAIIQAALSELTDKMLGGLNENQAAVAEIAQRNVARLNKIINNLLDIARLESGQIRPKFAMIKTETLFRETLAGLEKLAHEKGLLLKSKMASDLSEQINIDEDLIVQVLNNLVSNALRYAKTEIIIDVRNNEDGVLFSVKNDGPSLSRDDVAKLFQKFSQVNRQQGGGEYKGTGLGLAICKEIIKQHGGEIWVDSAEENLTCFRFVIPIKRSHSPSPAGSTGL